MIGFDMQILVLWADEASPNLGVRALGSGTATLVRRVWPDAEITFQNFGHRTRELPLGRIRSLARERVTGKLGMQRWLAGFDLVIDTRSGDSFSDIYGLHRLAVMCSVAELAGQAGVPVVLGPQTIGPFNTRRGRMLARRSLRRAALVMARDADSADQARQLGRPVDVLSTDVVFALPQVPVARTRDVVLGISGLLWHPNPHVDHTRYRDIMTRLHSDLLASGRRVSLLAHVLDSPTTDNDVPAVREFATRAAPDSEVIIPADLDEVRAAVASAQVVIASRMHACLNALSVGTPAIPLAYSKKFDPLFGGLGWNHTVDLRIVPDAVSATLTQLGDELLPTEAMGVIKRAHESLAHAELALREVW